MSVKSIICGIARMPVQQLLPFIMVGIVLISLAVLRISLHLSRFGSAFVRGVSHTTRSGEPYFWYYSPPRRHNRGVAELSIAADNPFEFTLERENRAHWLAEKLGFASKYQTDDPSSTGRSMSPPTIRSFAISCLIKPRCAAASNISSKTGSGRLPRNLTASPLSCKAPSLP